MAISPPLSLTGKRWILPEERSEGNLSDLLAEKRGIVMEKDVSWDDLGDPFALGDMRQAVERIRQAVSEKESIGIIGDYDADGVTGTAQFVRYFRRHGIEPHVILPHRVRDGFGVKREFIEVMKEKGVTLLLTVDTGIAYPAEIGYARSLGIDVVVTDHHSPKEELPDALLITLLPEERAQR